MRRLVGAVIVACFLAFCSAAAATPPNTPNITEPGTDNMVLNPADVHMEAPIFSDPDGNTHACTDWEIVTITPPETAWQAPCVVGVSKVHIHLGDGTFVNAHAGRQELKFDTQYKVRVRFKDSANEYSAWRERPFSTSPQGPPGVPSPIPWAVRQAGYIVEVVATGFQLPMNIAMVPNPGTNPDDPFMYVNELYGKIKVVTRSGVVSDFATGLLNFNPTGNFPGSGEQGVAGLALDPASGDLFASMVYEDTASTAVPKPHYSKVVRFHPSRRRAHAGDPDDDRRTSSASRTEHSHQISNVTIGPDGKLYVHQGDGFDFTTALNLELLPGQDPAHEPRRHRALGQPALQRLRRHHRARLHLRLRRAQPVRRRLAGDRRLPLRGRERSEHRPLRQGSGRPQLRLERRRRDDAQLRAVELGARERPGEHRVRAAGDAFGSGFPSTKMTHAYVTESGPTYATGPQTRGKRIVDFHPVSGNFSGTAPQNLIEYTGTGKATANGLAAGPDGLYFTDLYKDQTTNPIEAGANVLRVRWTDPQIGYPRPKGATPTRVPLVPAAVQCTARTARTGPRSRSARVRRRSRTRAS